MFERSPQIANAHWDKWDHHAVAQLAQVNERHGQRELTIGANVTKPVHSPPA